MNLRHALALLAALLVGASAVAACSEETTSPKAPVAEETDAGEEPADAATDAGKDSGDPGDASDGGRGRCRPKGASCTDNRSACCSRKCTTGVEGAVCE